MQIIVVVPFVVLFGVDPSVEVSFIVAFVALLVDLCKLYATVYVGHTAETMYILISC